MVKLNVRECFVDGPVFRAQLEYAEAGLSDLELRLDRVSSLFNEYAEASRRQSELATRLAGEITSFATCELSRKDEALDDILREVADSICIIEEHRDTLEKQSWQRVSASTDVFKRKHIQTLLGFKQKYHADRREMELAEERYSQCRPGNVNALSQSAKTLHDARKIVHKSGTEYVAQINMFEERKKLFFSEKVVQETALATASFFQLGHSIFAKLQPTLGRLVENIKGTLTGLGVVEDQIAQEAKNVFKDGETVRNEAFVRFQLTDLSCSDAAGSNQNAAGVEVGSSLGSLSNGEGFNRSTHSFEKSVHDTIARETPTSLRRAGKKSDHVDSERDANGELESKVTEGDAKREQRQQQCGYLNCLEKRGLLMHWSRYYYFIVDDLLMVQKSHKEPPELAANMLLCKVKLPDDIDDFRKERNFTFVVISPQSRIILQAETSEDLKNWLEALEMAIVQAFDTSEMSHRPPIEGSEKEAEERPSSGPSVDLSEVINMASNHLCADCSCKNPEWASVNLGITLCIACSGVHRSLGVHISQVRSLTLDRWRPHWVSLMLQKGNAYSNSIYQHEYEKRLQEGLLSTRSDQKFVKRPTAGSSLEERKQFIVEKYLNLGYVSEAMKERILAERSGGENNEKRSGENSSTSSYAGFGRNNATPSTQSDSAAKSAATALKGFFTKSFSKR
eukprot:Nk52_evm76s745 gene=Nk52_evmTU76s745